MLDSRGTKVTHLIALDVDDEEIIRRILERGKTSGRVDDSDEKTIRQRIDQYNEKTSPVYDFYDKVGISKKVNGLGDLPEIFNRIYDALS